MMSRWWLLCCFLLLQLASTHALLNCTTTGNSTVNTTTCLDTCKDGILNEDEIKVDCGGSCPDCTDPCGLASLSYNMRESERMVYPICVIFNSGTHRMHFYPVVDEFSLLEYSRSFSSSPFGFNTSMNGTLSPSSPSYIQVQVGKALSPKMPYRYQKTLEEAVIDYVVPFFTVIVDLKNGIPQSVSFDPGCFDCEEDECNFGTCGRQMRRSCDYFGGPLSCDLKVYVAWSGTDNDYRYLTSYGMVLSQFANYRITAGPSLAKTAGELFPQFSTPVDPGGEERTSG